MAYKAHVGGYLLALGHWFVYEDHQWPQKQRVDDVKDGIAYYQVEYKHGSVVP